MGWETEKKKKSKYGAMVAFSLPPIFSKVKKISWKKSLIKKENKHSDQGKGEV